MSRPVLEPGRCQHLDVLHVPGLDMPRQFQHRRLSLHGDTVPPPPELTEWASRTLPEKTAGLDIES